MRNELTRQKYVNQVLWRKLDALIDIHGSNTRAELAIELANYQDELAKLKIKSQGRPVDAVPTKSSSGLCPVFAVVIVALAMLLSCLREREREWKTAHDML